MSPAPNQEVYGKDVKESAEALYRHLESDIVGRRLLHHLMGHVYGDRGLAQERAKCFEAYLRRLERPRGIVFHDENRPKAVGVIDGELQHSL